MDKSEKCHSDITKEIITMQYKVLAIAHKMLSENDMELDKNFKKRVFENVEYLMHIERLIR